MKASKETNNRDSTRSYWRLLSELICFNGIVLITAILIIITTICMTEFISLPHRIYLYKQHNVSSNGETEQDPRYTLGGQTALDKKIYVEDLKIEKEVPENNIQFVEIAEPVAEDIIAEIPQPEISKSKDQLMIAPNVEAADGSWQNVSGTRYTFFVYSAFFDEAHDRRLKIYAVTHLSNPDEVWCRMWCRNGSHMATAKAELKEVNEHHELPYSALYVFCPIEGPHAVPYSVSVMKHLDMPSSNHLLVRELRKINFQANNNISISMCISPTYDWSNTMMLIEFLEYYKLLGVSHVTLYNSSMSADTACVLNNYKEKGFVTIFPWDFEQMKLRAERDVRVQAQPAALNDCLSRQKYRFTHVVEVDLDEFIVPQRHLTLQDLIRSIDPHPSTSLLGSYIIRSAFFYRNWPDDENFKVEDSIEKHLVTLQKTRRLNKLFPQAVRSKIILRPEFVEETGIHFVWIHVANYHEMGVAASDAILNHYRERCEYGTATECLQLPSGIDRTVYRYRHSLANNVKVIWNDLRNKCGLPEL